jgi:hypothetical protein
MKLHYGFEEDDRLSTPDHRAYYVVVQDGQGLDMAQRIYMSKSEYEKAILTDEIVKSFGDEEPIDPSKPVVNGIYQHIENGGVSFEVTNEHGPTISIQASHFGHITNQMKLSVTKESLHRFAQMFDAAYAYFAVEDRGPEYVCVSKTYITDKDTGKTITPKGEEGVQNSSAQTDENSEG